MNGFAKKIIFALTMMLIAQTASALEAANLDIFAQVDSAGNGTISEVYVLQFISPFEKEEFNQEAIQNSSSTQAWVADYDFFFAHIGGINPDIETSSITWDNESQRLTFQYTLRDKLATLIESEQRSDSFEISDRQLSAFNDSGTIVIPDNTTLRVQLPANSEVAANGLPQKAVVSGSSILLTGIQSNSLTISYRVLKPISPTGNQLVNGLPNAYLIAVPIVILALVALFVRREEVEKKIEDYLVKHSEIKTREVNEELDFEI